MTMNFRLDSPFAVPTDGSFRIRDARTAPSKLDGTEEHWAKKLKKRRKQLADLQRILYAHDKHSLLLVFQAMDAAGKDSTIRTVMSGVNPAGFQVSSFKQPSSEELDHDFLWRSNCRLPERGRIGIFNRSYYEETLVVRVHPEFLGGQRLPRDIPLSQLWSERYESIADMEQHLARNGTAVIKFWLNVSQPEQHRRFISRIDNEAKNWKFSPGDIAESKHWDAYMAAYQEVLNATAKDHAPWYAIPADNKAFMRMCVADIVVKTLRGMPISYPKPKASVLSKMKGLRAELEAGLKGKPAKKPATKKRATKTRATKTDARPKTAAEKNTAKTSTQKRRKKQR